MKTNENDRWLLMDSCKEDDTGQKWHLDNFAPDRLNVYSKLPE